MTDTSLNNRPPFLFALSAAHLPAFPSLNANVLPAARPSSPPLFTPPPTPEWVLTENCPPDRHQESRRAPVDMRHKHKRSFHYRFARNKGDYTEMQMKHNCEMTAFQLSDVMRQKKQKTKKRVFSSLVKPFQEAWRWMF